MVKFGFSEKATKFEKIFVVLLTRASCSVRATTYLSKSRRRFFFLNVDKSYYTNCTIGHEVTAYSISEGKLGMDISPSHMHFAKPTRILMNLVTLNLEILPRNPIRIHTRNRK